MNNSWILLEINVLIILIALLTLIYVKKLRFRYQRMLLLGAPILAILIIGLKSIWPGAVVTLDMPLINLNPVVVGQNIETISTPLKLTWTNLYFLGVILFLIVSLLKITRTALIFRNEDYDISEGVRLYRIANRHSFSFFNRIQLSPELDENAAEMVLDHEKLHVKKEHSLDLILMEIMHAIFWFNPVFFWLKSRLVNVHEYEVDENLFSKYDVNYTHFLLNYAMGIQSTKFVLSNPFFNQLTLKQRIMTMKTERQFSLKFWLILPVIAISGFFVQCTEEKVQPIEDRQSMAQDEESIQDEVLEIAEVMPEFEGGQEGMVAFIQENVTYPESSKLSAEEGTVYVTFVIDSEGKVKDPKIAKGVSDALNAEALRVVQSMPDWTPAMDKGKVVSVQFTLPISFRLN